jgi:hypothetical protein
MENGDLRFNGQIKWCKGEKHAMFNMDATTGMETQLRMTNAETDSIVRIAEAEMGTIPNSPAYYLSVLAGVDRRIRPSNGGMMEVVRHTEQHTEQQSRKCSVGSPSRNYGTQVPACVVHCRADTRYAREAGPVGVARN